jgi:molybdopterin molybdotransferase
LIPFEEALHILCEAGSRRPARTEEVPVTEMLGRVLAAPLVARHDSPRFDNSAVDGYAVRAADAVEGARLRVVGKAAAGERPPALSAGEAIRIFTGAPLPPGADAVLMQEDATLEGGEIRCESAAAVGDHVRRRGEEYRAEEELLPVGTVATPPVVGLVAAQGLTGFPCFARPRVAIVATGSELVPPGVPLGEGQIYESNGFALAAACAALGIVAKVEWVRDDRESLTASLAERLADHDLVVTSGGVSVGDHDLVRPVARELGVNERFWRVNVKPGKPVYFGERDGSLLLGLPGNPVSALVTFALFARPLILRLMRARGDSPVGRARLGASLRKRPGRHEFVRAVLRDGTATPTKGQGSHMLGGLAAADVLIHFPEERSELATGEEVSFTPLRWSHV